MLYAALHSGPRTQFVTRDELRNHKYLLGEELADNFVQWQRSQQILFSGIYIDKKKNLYLSIRVS